MTEQVGDYAVMKSRLRGCEGRLQNIEESSFSQQQKLIKKTLDNIRLQKERTFFSVWYQNVTAIRRSRFVLLKMKIDVCIQFLHIGNNVYEIVSQRKKLKDLPAT